MRKAFARSRAASYQDFLDVHPTDELTDGAGNNMYEEKEDPQWCIKHVTFFLMCCIVGSFSGGVVLGVGPLMTALARDGYFEHYCGEKPVPCVEEFNQMGGMFNGGFQIMTWGSVLVTLLLSRLGPRMIAATGALVATSGAYCFYLASTDSKTYVFIQYI